MLIACASDAHGHAAHARAMLAALPPVHALMYLGDTDADAQRLQLLLAEQQPTAQFHAVCGNCDLFSRLPATEIHVMAGQRVLITHGHRFSVKQGLELLSEAAAQNACTLALFGHTHIPHDGFVSGVHLCNPGALKDGRYALIDMDNDAHVQLLSV